MRFVTVALLVLIALVHAELWFGKGGVPRVMELEAKLAEQKARNDAARTRNEQMTAEVSDPKERRLIIDCSGQVMRAAVRLREADLREPPKDKGWDELLARLAQNQKKSRATAIIDAEAVPVAK